MQKTKIGVIGVGHVGAHVMYMLAREGLADEIVLVDINEKKVASERQDLCDTALYLPRPVKVRVGAYEDLGDCDVIVNSAGKVDMLIENNDRWLELKFNNDAVHDYMPKVKAAGFTGIVINISNPCDTITEQIAAILDLPRGQVFGTGTGLDTARFIALLADAFDLDAKSLTAYMLGEHGAGQFAPWSQVRIGGKSLDELARTDERFQIDRAEIEDQARKGGWVTFAGKYCTEYAIASTAVRYVKAVLNDEHIVAPVTTALDGEYGEHDVFAGVPAVIGRNGAEHVIELDLTDEERATFHTMCEGIRSNRDKLM
jgi:L-lactate dehydrogenase